MMVMVGVSHRCRFFAATTVLVDLSWQIKHVWPALGSSPVATAVGNGCHPKAAGKTDETRTRFAACPAQAPHATRAAVAPNHKEHSMKKLTLSALVIVASSAVVSTALAQDAEAGKTSFNKCLACHAIGEGAKNKVGPVLNGIDGRKSGTAEGYSYSDANKNSGITWNKEQFLDYIKDPRAKIPGTKMIFAGIKNETEAANLWAYLAQYDKDGKIKAK
jgi:cytochrome c